MFADSPGHEYVVTASVNLLPPPTVDNCIPTRFRLVASRFPDHPAVVNEHGTISYAALDTWSDRIAQQIRTVAGTEPRPLAIYLGQGAQAVAAILGVLKVGHFYAVLDPAIPDKRMESILENLAADHVVTDMTNLAIMGGPLAQLQVIDCDVNPPESAQDTGYGALSPETLAAIYYTSGTTGIPKGVLFDHKLILHRASQDVQVYPLGPGDVTAMLFSPAYSSSASDIFGALLNGGALTSDPTAHKSATEFRQWLDRQRVTVLHLHATMLRELLDSLPADYHFEHLRYVRVSGGTRT